jgi:hypothetical protein
MITLFLSRWDNRMAFRPNMLQERPGKEFSQSTRVDKYNFSCEDTVEWHLFQEVLAYYSVPNYNRNMAVAAIKNQFVPMIKTRSLMYLDLKKVKNS